MKYYVHSVPGRLRLKIPELRNNTYQCQETQALLLGLEGVQDVQANCLTGSVLVHYDEAFISSADITSALEENDLFAAHLALGPEEYRKKAAVHAGEAVGKALFGWAVGRALERASFGLLAAFI
ncbi:MAG: hypothetical protein KQJ78_06495 [Deltaproteobacteria bacterium]|nr:hypothetical protein [Deltaproteobacteria bacterium]